MNKRGCKNIEGKESFRDKPNKNSFNTFNCCNLYNGAYIFRLNKEKNEERDKVGTLNTTITELEKKIDTLQQKLNTIANTLNDDGIKNDLSSKESSMSNNKYTLKLGNYKVNEVKVNDSGVSNEECEVKLKENNKFEIYMGWSAWHLGNYEIKECSLICYSNSRESQVGQERTKTFTDVRFTIKILTDNKLELESIDIKDTNTEKLVFNEGLAVGMTYSIK